MELLNRNRHLALLGALLAILMIALLRPYGWNASAVFHMDTVLSEKHAMSGGFVVLDVPAYDGAQYYLVARNIPDMLRPSRWEYLQSVSPTSYGYQRFLLPLTALALSLGQTGLLPYAFLLINLTSLLLAFWIVLRAFPDKPLYAYAVALCPAAMVGLHFNLAEPLTLLLLAIFLIRFARSQRLEGWDATLLSLLVLTREVNILFAGLVGLFVLLRRQWSDVALALIPLAAFLLLHGWIYAIFGEMPFFMSTGKSTFPFQAVYELLTGGYGYDYKTLTSIPLFLLFVFPGLVWTGSLIVSGKDRSFSAIGSFFFLLLMCAMPDHIVGSITSIGRVITPVYPLVILLAAKHDARPARYLAIIALLIGVAAAISLASVIHPFTPVP